MTSRFIETITSSDPAARDRSFHRMCAEMAPDELFQACEELELFRRSAENLYQRVRATLFLYSAYRFFLMESSTYPRVGIIPREGFEDLLSRRFEEAIERFRKAMQKGGPNGALLSALAEAYHHLAFQYLVDQVRNSVRASSGNRWMFRVGHYADHPVKLRPELLQREEGMLLYPILWESTPVRLDLSHSGWSDIFFLGMDYPEGARVLNISVDLGVYGRDDRTRPPVETYVRAIPEPLLRVTSVDLQTTKDITDLQDLFNFGNDYLSLVKAGIIASGLIPPSFEGTDQPLDRILERIVGRGMGMEIVTRVNDIPKGSRLAVSTNLLASIVSVLMRATGQVEELHGTLKEQERRLVASRAILGEWLGGSGGGWQDSGGIWPGFKIIQGALAQEGDPEFGVSRGCLLPVHKVLGLEHLHPDMKDRLTRSLVLIHGGMAQNVGPILEMVTEKYLLRDEAEWKARQDMRAIFDGIVAGLAEGRTDAVANSTMANWEGPLKTIIPWVSNYFTETIIAKARETLGRDFHGFLMLGGMSGGGMGMFVSPDKRDAFRDQVLSIMRRTKSVLEDILPFAMDPVVYDFSVNEVGTHSRLLVGNQALMPTAYYALQVPEMVRQNPETISYNRRAELDHFTSRCTNPEDSFGMLRSLVGNLFRVNQSASQTEKLHWDAQSEDIKTENGFDRIQHEDIRNHLIGGRIGLSRNRLPLSTDITDVEDTDYRLLEAGAAGDRGLHSIREGRVAILSLAGGVGSRWTTGAGVIKALNPFVQMAGKHRSFLEIHLAKTRRLSREYGVAVPHVVSTSFLTHGPVAKHLELNNNYGYEGPLYLSPGRSISQRLVPMVRDLMFLWEETPQETLDEQKQKVRAAVRSSLMSWAREKGEGSDYTDNLPIQRFNPPGHWYELPNLLRNGVMARLLREHPDLRTIMLHNIDTLGVSVDPDALAMHQESGAVLTFEVVPRRISDRGGGLARVNGQVRLLEGLAQPRDEDELALRYYNTMTTWIEIDPLLKAFGLMREDLYGPAEKIAEAVRTMAHRVPTYVTIKDVKRRWGHGQEDVYPVAQFEKLWGDMTALPNLSCNFLAVSRLRGQQLKAMNELDAWANDGSKEYVQEMCDFL